MWPLLLLLLVGARALGSCPQHCHCHLEDGLRTANCSGSALTTHQQPSQVDVLNVRPHYGGFRTRLSPRGFQNFKNIKFLNLSNTSVTIVPDEVFYGLNYIITIDLSYNKIKHLNGGVFKQLSTLRTLLLRGNPLMFIQSDFIVSSSLRKLDLGNCGLRYIPAGMFAHVSSLTMLFLDGNFIQTLDRHSVPAGLTYLNLANNNIVNVPTDVLQKMKSLTRVDVSGNPVRCTCQLSLLQDTFSGQGRIFENDITCSGPRQFYGQKLSQINENDLCNLEFIKKQRFTNSIKHFRDRDVRSYRKHNMIKPLPTDDSFGIQGDQPLISDELAPTHDSEVMFSNDDTRSMGTHMDLNSFTIHNPPSLHDISDENNKLPVSKQSLPVTDSDPSSTEGEVMSSEEESAVQVLPEEDPDYLVNAEVTVNHNKSDIHTVTDLDSAEDFNESSPQMDEQHSSTEQTEKNLEDKLIEAIKVSEPVPVSSTELEEVADSSKEKTDSLTMLNQTQLTEDFVTDHETSSDPKEVITESMIIHDKEELTSGTPLEVSSQHSDDDTESITVQTDVNISSSLDDVEEISTHTHNTTNEPLARYSHVESINSTGELDDSSISSVDDIFQNESVTTLGPEKETYTWPSSHSDTSDYNYDATHDYYSSVDPLKHADTSADGSPMPLTTAVYTNTSQDVSTTEESIVSSKYIDLEEGSGFASNETEGDIEELSSVTWLEEQENETATEDYQVENVSEVFNVTSSELEKSSHYTAESETTPVDESTTVLPASESSGEVSESEEVSATEESSTEVATMESSSADTSPDGVVSEEVTASPVDYETETVTTDVEDETHTEESTTEAGIPLYETDLVHTVSTESSTASESSSASEEPSSSSSFSIPLEISSESTSETISEDVTTEHIASSTESSPVPVLIPEEEAEKEVSSTSSSITSDSPPDTGSVDLDVSVEPTPESISSTPVVEVEVVSKHVHEDEKENMVLDPTKQEISKNEDTEDEPDIAMIGIIAAVVLLIVLLLLISMAVVCRRSKRPKNKVRLPADPEANLGTEMQDMLLPKAPENGVKVVPKNYTNGTTAAAANGNKPEQKEEEIPVLAAEPDVPAQEETGDWEEKPEPIETVTARLTMLARPQTPVFIPKSLN